MRPLIAIAAMRSPRVDGLRREGHVASQRVVESVYRAGGEPVILPPVNITHSHQLGHYKGVVLPGGRDIDPVYYGEPAHTDHGPFDHVHDRVDLQLAHDVVASGIPTLAICRGMQILNVALGGTLFVDLPKSNVEHGSGFHTVNIASDSAVAKAMGTTTPTVSTCHHQGVRTLGRDLIEVGHAEDGCIEAVAHTEAPILAVQWHPEDDADVTDYEQALFDALVDPGRWMTTHTTKGART